MNNSQLPMAEYQSKKLNFVAILIAQQLVLLPLYFFIPIWIAVLNILLVITVYYTQIRQQFVVPTWLKVIVTVVAVAGVLVSFRKLAGRDAGVSLIAIMYGLKIIELKARRDAYILLLLGFFILLAGFLFSQSPWIALYQFIPVTAILNALTSVHSLERKSNALQSSFFQTLKKLGFYLILAIPLMIVLFVFFPRLSGPIWRMPGGGHATSGISDTMSPGEISSLQLFDQVAFRVKFKDKTPRSGEMYWRTLVLDQFDGLTWSRHSHKLDKNSSVNRLRIANADASNSEQSRYRYEMSLESTQQKWLTFLDRPIAIPNGSEIYSDFAVQVDHRLVDRTRYSGLSQLVLTLDRKLSRDDKKRFTQLPEEGNPRARDWSKNMRARYQSDQAYIQALLAQIHRQPYFYTLTPPIMQRDTVDSFWFDERKGFCEHYAGALVYLARAANIPARVVIGYQGGERNPLSDYWIVRYANAHAWTEIWLQDKGWMRVDPTAAIASERIEKQLQQDYSQRDSLFEDFGFEAVDLNDIGMLKQFQYWMDKANTGWNDWVLDYNKENQRRLFDGLGLRSLDSKQIAVLMIAILAIFMMVISSKWVIQRSRLAPMQQAFSVFNRKLASAGLEIEINQDVSQLINHLKMPNQPLSIRQRSRKEVIDILKKYQFLRYQINQASEKQQKDFLQQVNALRIRASK